MGFVRKIFRTRTFSKRIVSARADTSRCVSKSDALARADEISEIHFEKMESKSPNGGRRGTNVSKTKQ
jgi:hypothetical protein